MQARPRLILAIVLGGTGLAALSGPAFSASPSKAKDLPKGSVPAKLAPGTTYEASLLEPTPSLTPTVDGWGGFQFDSHTSGKVRYENALLFWKDARHEVDIISGPAMTMSPAATLAKPLSRHFNFGPYAPPTPVKHWAVAGRQALYFDATAPPPGEWSIVGSNPPELRIEHDNSFRMAALTIRGQTVVIVIHGPATDFKKFLPISLRLVASFRFRSS
jgi:hypothetical protein